MFSSFNPRAIGLSIAATDAIALAAEAGFNAVDLLVRDLLTAGLDPVELRRRMDDLGIMGGAFPLPMSWRGDETTFRRDLAELPRYADAASALGLIRTGTWVMPELPEGMDRKATLALHLDRLGAIADVLGQNGIRLGLEVIGVARFRNGRTPSLFTKLGDLTPLLGPLKAAHANVGLLLDSFHLYAAGEALDDALAPGIETVVWVHIADLPAGATGDRGQIEDHERGLPGERGLVPNREVLASLHHRGYDGPVTAEPMAGCRSLAGMDPSASAFAVARAVRSVWPQPAPGSTAR